MGWLERLAEVEERKSSQIGSHNTRGTTTNLGGVEDSKNRKACGYRTDKRGQKGQSAAEEFGLCAAWSYEFGFVSLHDPATGERHDLPTKDAPDWAVREARRRKELYKSGDRKAYRYTSGEMEELLEAEHAPEPEGIVEDHPIEGEEE